MIEISTIAYSNALTDLPPYRVLVAVAQSNRPAVDRSLLYSEITRSGPRGHQPIFLMQTAQHRPGAHRIGRIADLGNIRP
jgi:hypothetical protein